MATWRAVGFAYGVGLLAEGLVRGFKALDKQLGVDNKPPMQRASTWLEVIGTFGIPIAVVYGRIQSPYDILLLILGSHFVRELVKVAEEASAQASFIAARPVS